MITTRPATTFVRLEAPRTVIRYALSYPPQVPFAATRPGAVTRIVERLPVAPSIPPNQPLSDL
jgi:hypothetical protein